MRKPGSFVHSEKGLEFVMGAAKNQRLWGWSDEVELCLELCPQSGKVRSRCGGVDQGESTTGGENLMNVSLGGKAPKLKLTG